MSELNLIPRGLDGGMIGDKNETPSISDFTNSRILPSGKEAKPNIILLMGDDHGWEEVGYNDHPLC